MNKHDPNNLSSNKMKGDRKKELTESENADQLIFDEAPPRERDELEDLPADQIEAPEMVAETEAEKKPRTVKIVSERDMEIKEAPPPNFSHRFSCWLHFRRSKYSKRKLLMVEDSENSS